MRAKYKLYCLFSGLGVTIGTFLGYLVGSTPIIAAILLGSAPIIAAIMGGLFGALVGAFCVWLILAKIDKHLRENVFPSEVAEVTHLESENKRLMAEIKENLYGNKHLVLVGVKKDLIEPAEDTPDQYICPITGMVINDPVFIDPDKHAYERSAIAEWYQRSSKKTCPLNPGASLQDPSTLKTDLSLQSEIKAYVPSLKH